MRLRVILKKREVCSRLADRVIVQVRFELEQIDRLLELYGRLLESAQTRTPDLVEVTAIASVLHSFYNGLENALQSIAKGLDGALPTGSQSHRELLDQVATSTSKRPAIISVAVREKLNDYLAFRHFYRHSYSFFLDWDEMKGLVAQMPSVWLETKAELQSFLEKLS